MSDVLGRAVIEVGVDEMRLQDEIQSTQSTLTKSFNESLKRTKLEAGERAKLTKITKDLAYLDTQRVKLADAQVRNTVKLTSVMKNQAEVMKQLLRMPISERQKLRGGKTLAETMPGWGDSGKHVDYGSKVRNMVSVGMAGIAGAGALTFAGAAAAGSTTLNTLTGSLKMLSLTAGEKVQPAIMNISRSIQNFASTLEKSPSGAIGTTGGALIGGRIAGLPGMVAGGLVGYLLEKIPADFSEKGQMVEKLRKNPEHVAKLMQEIAKLENEDPWYSFIPFTGNKIEIAKRKGAIATFQHQQKTAQFSASGILAAIGGAAGVAMAGGGTPANGFKTAGLNMPMTMTGLASAYDQGNINMMGSSPLDQANQMKEWQLNAKAMMEGARSRTSVDPNFVGPPQGN